MCMLLWGKRRVKQIGVFRGASKIEELHHESRAGVFTLKWDYFKFLEPVLVYPINYNM